MKTVRFLFIMLLVGVNAFASTLDLSGEWRFALDPHDHGIRAKPDGWHFPDTIRLSGTVTAQGFGETPSMKTNWTGDGWRYPELFKEWQTDDNFKFPFFLQPPLHYVGPAWYQREIDVPGDWWGSESILWLERVHWQSTVWIDGREVGKCDSLGTPHDFNLGVLTQGRHVLTLRIDNRLAPVNVGPLSHSVTDHTQGNWNGVVGKVELREAPSCGITDVQVYPSMDGSLRITVSGRVDVAVAGAGIRIEVSAGKESGQSVFLESETIARNSDGTFSVECRGKLSNPRLWSEFSPNLHTARTILNCGDDMPEDIKSVTFGFREPGKSKGRLAINGSPIFLRGTLECCVFPLTGHPPTDVESWKRIVRICKAHGLNHIRFHSWCPPEAAFIAADELGFYYQVEVSSWANQGARIGSGLPLDEWLERETNRMLATYGNHPSFLLMAYGNEPSGENHAKWLQDWVARRKQQDPRRFYTTAAGWPLMAGSDFHNMPQPRLQGWGQGMGSIINGQPPRTDFDWSGFVNEHPDAPVVSHEIGQWCVYPNFGEIDKYSGYFKAKNFEIFQETARRNGLLPQAKDFLAASGKLQTLCYKHDIEAALRTPGFGGFQLLDLHDFPGQGTALVGVLDAFWDSKGYVTAREYARFSGPVVPLAVLKKMVWQTDETLEAKLMLSHFGPAGFTALEPSWQLADGETVIARGLLPARDLSAGTLHGLGSIRIPLDKLKAPARLVLTVGAKDQSFSNDWDIFVYPVAAEATPAAPDITVTRSLADALSALENGGKVLWMPEASEIRNDAARPLVAGFSSIFWNTAWTEWQPPHTLGILCDPAHAAFAGFPTDSHSNWQWWEIQRNAQPFILTEMRDLKPLVQVIDDWVTGRKLAYVFEARVGKGKLVASAADLTDDPRRRPAARQLLTSLLGYMRGPDFSPAVSLEPGDLGKLIER